MTGPHGAGERNAFVNEERRRAETLIKEYLQDEFGESSFDPEDTGLAFTTLCNPELFKKRGILDFNQEVEIRVSCNINDLIVTTYINSMPLRMDRYGSLKEMNDVFLSSLSFDGLVYLDPFDWGCAAGILLKEQNVGRKEEIA